MRQKTKTVIVVLAGASAAAGQEAINMDAATHPSRGVFYVREQVRYFDYDGQGGGEDRGDVQRWKADTWLTYGIRHDLAVQVEAPLVFETRESPDGGGDDDEFGFGDPSAFLKYRFFTRDLGAVDTVRASALAGIEAPFGSGPLSSHSWDPFIGAVVTWIGGRHGASGGFRYKFNTGEDRGRNLGGDGPDDALNYDASYLFRLAPQEWASDTNAAWYVVAEFNGLYETNGDNELLFSPGLLYEARHWAAELTIQLPIAQDVQHRPELNWAIGAGLRLSF